MVVTRGWGVEERGDELLIKEHKLSVRRYISSRDFRYNIATIVEITYGVLNMIKK